MGSVKEKVDYRIKKAEQKTVDRKKER